MAPSLNTNQKVKPPELGDNKRSRPLNSFMAFRSYYGVIFVSVQQKQRSGLLKTLWKCDPFQAKWYMVAKAYSVIRAINGKDQCDLRDFLNLAVPFLGLPAACQYMEIFGYSMFNAPTVNEMMIVRTSEPNFSEAMFTSEVTVQDLVQHTIDNGYAISNIELILEGAANAEMAMSIRPTIVEPQDFDLANATSQEVIDYVNQICDVLNVPGPVEEGCDDGDYNLLDECDPLNLYELMPPHDERENEIEPDYKPIGFFPHNEEFFSMETGFGMDPYTSSDRVALDITEGWAIDERS